MAGRRQVRGLRGRRGAALPLPFAWLILVASGVLVGLVGGGRWWWGAAQSHEELAAQLIAAVGADEAKRVEADGQFGFVSLELTAQRDGMEQVVWATLPPDQGWVAVLSRDRQAPGGWLRLGRSPELAHITRVQPVQPVSDPAPELLVETEYDARVGALSYIRQAHLLKWNEAQSQLAVIWQTTLWEEAYSPDPPFARKRIVETRCQFRPNQVLTRSSHREYQRENAAGASYRLVRETVETQMLRWQPQTFRFEAVGAADGSPKGNPIG